MKPEAKNIQVYGKYSHPKKLRTFKENLGKFFFLKVHQHFVSFFSRLCTALHATLTTGHNDQPWVPDRLPRWIQFYQDQPSFFPAFNPHLSPLVVLIYQSSWVPAKCLNIILASCFSTLLGGCWCQSVTQSQSSHIQSTPIRIEPFFGALWLLVS